MNERQHRARVERQHRAYDALERWEAAAHRLGRAAEREGRPLPGQASWRPDTQPRARRVAARWVV